MKTKKNESVNEPKIKPKVKKESISQLKKTIKKLNREKEDLLVERNRYRSLSLKLYKQSLSAVSGNERMLIKPEFIIEECTIAFINSESFYIGSLKL